MSALVASAIALSDAARAVLTAATCTAHAVQLPDAQLARPIYEEVNTVLTRLGGKWKGGKTRAHVFAHYAPAPLVHAVLETGLLPADNPLAYFPTPAPVVAAMLHDVDFTTLGDMPASVWECLDRDGGIRAIEPSAGTGSLADAIRQAAPRVHLDCIEVNPLSVGVLQAKGHTVVAADFLTFTPSAPYDYCFLNPPFSVAGNPRAYQDHIRHAWSMLSPNGRLVAIAPPGFTFRTSAADRAFRNFCIEHGDWSDLAAGTFKESGTGIATVMITLHARPTGRRPVESFHCWHCWNTQIVAANNDVAYEHERAALVARVASGQLAGAFTDAASPAALALDAHFDAVIDREQLRVVLLPECRAQLRAHVAASAEPLTDAYPELEMVPSASPVAEVLDTPSLVRAARPAQHDGPLGQGDLFAAA